MEPNSNEAGTEAPADVVDPDDRGGLAGWYGRWSSRIYTAFMCTAYAMFAEAAPASAIANPLDGISPNMDALGPAFNSSWKRLGGAIWAVVLGILAFKVITSTLKRSKAKRNAASGDLAEATEDLQEAGLMLLVCAMASVIIGAILYVASPS